MVMVINTPILINILIHFLLLLGSIKHVTAEESS